MMRELTIGVWITIDYANGLSWKTTMAAITYYAGWSYVFL
jgi:hypothetical protein